MLERFGDPVKIARRLWYDAMKEKIMSQRITLSVMCILTAAAVAACGIMLKLVTRVQATNQQLVASMEDLNNNLVAALERMTVRGSEEPSHGDDWHAVKVKLLASNENGPPIEGFSVSLTSKGAAGAPGGVSLHGETNADGIADFGLLGGGQYELRVTSPWGATAHRSAFIGPGRPDTIRIICPKGPPELTDVRFTVEWPEDLRDKGLWFMCVLNAKGVAIDGEIWSAPNDASARGDLPGQPLLIAPVLTTEVMMGFPYSKAVLLDKPTRQYLMNVRISLIIHNAGKARPIMRIASGSYSLSYLAVLSPEDNKRVNESDEPQKFRILSNLWNRQIGGRPSIISGDHQFTAKPGTTNDWRITLSEEALEQVREGLELVE